MSLPTKPQENAISPRRSENFPEWFQEAVSASGLAEHSKTRGCMIIKPYGYALWEKIQKELDRRICRLGAQNVYFPLLIPLSYFEKEAEHVAGFAKECAVVTHHRLEARDGKLYPAGPLEEPFVVRPTSEMVIGEAFSRWIQSWRDLPMKVNQWANVMRWEMRTRLFLRTAEFLWQEGHTAHESAKEAEEMTLAMLQEYRSFAEDYLAIPVIVGKKSRGEQFPGAEWTYTYEGVMQDGKALQCGTSHNLGQNFAKACGIKFLGRDSKEQYAYTTSWGTTTRLIGAITMVHGDDDGLRLAPMIAPYQLVILPFLMKEGSEAVIAACKELQQELEALSFNGQPLRIHLDLRDMRGGEKSWEWVKKGVPLRLEVGARDLNEGSFPLFSRLKAKKDSKKVAKENLGNEILESLALIQKELFDEAKKRQESQIFEGRTLADLEAWHKEVESGKRPLGLILLPFAGDVEMEEKIREKYGLTIRVIPNNRLSESYSCPFTGKEGAKLSLFGQAY